MLIRLAPHCGEFNLTTVFISEDNIMFDDENESKRKKPYQLGQKIDELSVGDLKELIGDLKAEITRLENEADAKNKSLGAAEALFKS